MVQSAYLFIAHGSREIRANEDFFSLLQKFRRAYPKRRVEGAFLELAKPSIPEGINRLAKQGAREIFIIPLMLFSGRHVQQHIPRIIEEAKAEYPEIDFHFSGPLTDHPLMMRVLDAQAGALKRSKRKS